MVLYSILLYSTLRYSTLHYSTLLYSTLRYATLLKIAKHNSSPGAYITGSAFEVHHLFLLTNNLVVLLKFDNSTLLRATDYFAYKLQIMFLPSSWTQAVKSEPQTTNPCATWSWPGTTLTKHNVLYKTFNIQCRSGFLVISFNFSSTIL